jgi:hypothetical protein
MKYTVRKSIIQLVGKIWMPGIVCGQEKTLTAHDVENCRGDDGKITRESVEQWLTSHSGDLSSVIDFMASIADGEETIDIPWKTEEGEIQYIDATAQDDGE